MTVPQRDSQFPHHRAMSCSSSASSHRQRVYQTMTAVSRIVADRLSLRRVSGMSTELADVTEVEYRQLLPRARGTGQRLDHRQ